MKTIEETRLVLNQAAYYDHRTIDPKMLDQWHHALMRQSIEHAFDAVHTHFERCDDAHANTLTAGHVLEHANRAREQREHAERKQRDQQRNEAIFGQFHDHRTPDEQLAAHNAAKAGRAHIDAILEQRKQTTNHD